MSYILLVDDEEQVLRLYRMILSEEGYKVQTASSGTEALRLLEQEDNTPDMVITDLEMGPGIKGDELSARIKMMKPKCPIIMVTGSPEPPHHKADMVMSKPISYQKFLEAVKLLLKQ